MQLGQTKASKLNSSPLLVCDLHQSTHIYQSNFVHEQIQNIIPFGFSFTSWGVLFKSEMSENYPLKLFHSSFMIKSSLFPVNTLYGTA